MSEKLLEMKGVTKIFGKCIANSDVDLDIYPGEIHALLGENGAGKSTLMNCLTGIYKPDKGEIFYKGKPTVIGSPKDAVNIGIGMVHQHFRLINTLSVAENVMLNSGRCPFILNLKDIYSEIEECSDQFNLGIEPEAKIWQLSVGEQQRVEIVKLLYRGADILILDEPSAVLTPQESDEMFRTLRNMADKGKAVIVISHKMNEVLAHSDRVTVLRGGKSIGTLKTKETTREELVQMMVGRELKERKRHVSSNLGDVILKGVDLSANNDRGLPALKNANIEVRRGEIFGIAGVAGNGQRMLAEVLTGLRPLTNGKVIYKDEDITRESIGYRVKRGVSFVPEDRLGMGLIPSMDMMENLILKRYSRPVYSNKGILKKKEVREDTEKTVAKNDIKNAGLENPIRLMSGGNQQKLLVSRENIGNPDLLVICYPARGLDIGAVDSIHDIMNEEKERGAAILMISEELDEIFEMSDRIGVLFDGYLSKPIDPDTVTREDLGNLMAGVGLDENTAAKESDYQKEVTA